MKTEFYEDEMMILAMYKEPSREESIKAMQAVLKDLSDEPDMLELVQETIAKLSQITDEEYIQIDLEGYNAEPEDISAEADEV